MASADFGEWKSANVVNEKPRYWRMETDISLDDHPLGHCAIPAFVPSKTFSRNKTHHRVHLVPPKTFSWNKTPYKVHLVSYKTFSRNQTPLKTHLVQFKTFIRNKIVSGRRARLRLSAFLPGTWLMLHHRTRRIQDCCCSPRRLHRRYLESRGCRQVAHHHPGACRKGIMKRHVLVNGFDHICG